MISASDFRNGITIEKDGSVLEIVEFQHVKPGKGAAFVRTKLKCYRDYFPSYGEIPAGKDRPQRVSVSVSGW